MLFKQFRKIISVFLIAAFTGSSLYIPEVRAGEMVLPVMPVPGTRVDLSPVFMPAHLKGITINPTNGLEFDFLIHKGDGGLDESQKKEEYNKLIKYFLASLTIPEEDQWVNLSPYENSRIIQNNFGKTEMGRDLLSQDYLLKQITSSLMYPESGLGKTFWDKVYERAYKEYGSTTSIPVNTFNKVWIVPDEALVYESGNTAYVLKSHLKVMLEEDYLSKQKHSQTTETTSSGLTSKIIREVLLPELEKEVNEGKNFAMLRQIYSGMILATWYKKALKESLLGKIYADKAKVKGIDQDDPKANEEIYQKYITAFKKGVYNYIKEDTDKYTNQTIPRKYFAGGFQPNLSNEAMTVVNENNARSLGKSLLAAVTIGIAAIAATELVTASLAAPNQAVQNLQAKQVAVLSNNAQFEVPAGSVAVLITAQNKPVMIGGSMSSFNQRAIEERLKQAGITSNDSVQVYLYGENTNEKGKVQKLYLEFSGALTKIYPKLNFTLARAPDAQAKYVVKRKGDRIEINSASGLLRGTVRSLSRNSKGNLVVDQAMINPSVRFERQEGKDLVRFELKGVRESDAFSAFEVMDTVMKVAYGLEKAKQGNESRMQILNLNEVNSMAWPAYYKILDAIRFETTFPSGSTLLFIDGNPPQFSIPRTNDANEDNVGKLESWLESLIRTLSEKSFQARIAANINDSKEGLGKEASLYRQALQTWDLNTREKTRQDLFIALLSAGYESEDIITAMTIIASNLGLEVVKLVNEKSEIQRVAGALTADSAMTEPLPTDYDIKDANWIFNSAVNRINSRKDLRNSIEVMKRAAVLIGEGAVIYDLSDAQNPQTVTVEMVNRYINTATMHLDRVTHLLVVALSFVEKYRAKEVKALITPEILAMKASTAKNVLNKIRAMDPSNPEVAQLSIAIRAIQPRQKLPSMGDVTSAAPPILRIIEASLKLDVVNLESVTSALNLARKYAEGNPEIGLEIKRVEQLIAVKKEQLASKAMTVDNLRAIASSLRSDLTGEAIPFDAVVEEVIGEVNEGVLNLTEALSQIEEAWMSAASLDEAMTIVNVHQQVLKKLGDRFGESPDWIKKYLPLFSYVTTATDLINQLKSLQNMLDSAEDITFVQALITKYEGYKESGRIDDGIWREARGPKGRPREEDSHVPWGSAQVTKRGLGLPGEDRRDRSFAMTTSLDRMKLAEDFFQENYGRTFTVALPRTPNPHIASAESTQLPGIVATWLQRKGITWEADDNLPYVISLMLSFEDVSKPDQDGSKTFRVKLRDTLLLEDEALTIASHMAQENIEVRGASSSEQRYALITEISKRFPPLTQGQAIKDPNYNAIADHFEVEDGQAKLKSVGGIDLNAANLDLVIKRDGNGVPLPINQQDMQKLNGIEGFIPVIIQITPVNTLPILSELQQKLQAA
jgi:hypothetical protein